MFEKIRLDPVFLPSIEEVKKYGKENFGYSKMRQLLNGRKKSDGMICEIWTEEYISRISLYLAELIRELNGGGKNPVTVLEVGAGNGKLSHFLRERIEGHVPGAADIVACDSYSDESVRKYGAYIPLHPVEKLSHDEALKKYSPDIVIFSWMPYGYDCTDDFRATESVSEYILIGEDGCCGRAWETWGSPWAYGYDEDRTPPYEKDGFTQEEIESVRGTQISRLELLDMGRTETRCFKKIRKSG